MNLVRDVLDQQVIDSEERKTGKVDGIAIELREGLPPRVAFLDIGPDVVTRRLSVRLGRFAERLRRRFAEPFHVGWADVKKVHGDVRLHVDAEKSSAFVVEDWLREHIVCKIPGNAHQKHQEKSD